MRFFASVKGTAGGAVPFKDTKKRPSAEIQPRGRQKKQKTLCRPLTFILFDADVPNKRGSSLFSARGIRRKTEKCRQDYKTFLTIMTFPPSSFLVLHIIYHASVTLSMVFLKIFCEIYIFFRDFFGRFHQKTHISRRGRRKTPRNHKILILFSCFTSLSQRADDPSAPRGVSICRAGAQTAFFRR